MAAALDARSRAAAALSAALRAGTGGEAARTDRARGVHCGGHRHPGVHTGGGGRRAVVRPAAPDRQHDPVGHGAAARFGGRAEPLPDAGDGCANGAPGRRADDDAQTGSEPGAVVRTGRRRIAFAAAQPFALTGRMTFRLRLPNAFLVP